MSEPVLAQFSREEVIEGCRANLDLLASIAAPDIYSKPFPPIYLAYWQELTTSALTPSGVIRLALGIPRGFAKTFLLQLFCVWVLLYTDRKFILIVCNTLGHSKNFIAQIFAMLAEPNIVKVFGAVNMTKGDRDTLDQKTFTFRGRECVLAGIGSGSSVRGINIEGGRPDTFILDDMQNRDQAENAEIAAELLTWMYGTLMKARNYSRALFIFIGNMYPFEGSILRKIRRDPNWTSLVTGAILADGESIWPEFRPLEDLIAEFDSDCAMGLAHIFFAEVMNDDTAGTASGIDLSKLPPAVELDPNSAVAGYVIIDPSLGKKKSDAIAIGVTLLADAIPHIAHLEEFKDTPHALMMRAIRLASDYGLGAIVIEANSSQEYLRLWFESVVEQLGITGLQILPCSPKNAVKAARIRDAIKIWLSGEITMAPKPRAMLVYQLAQWNPLKPKPVDDLLDVMAYSTTIHLEYPSEIARMFIELESDPLPEPTLPW